MGLCFCSFFVSGHGNGPSRDLLPSCSLVYVICSCVFGDVCGFEKYTSCGDVEMWTSCFGLFGDTSVEWYRLRNSDPKSFLWEDVVSGAYIVSEFC